jgi:competence protein ComEA
MQIRKFLRVAALSTTRSAALAAALACAVPVFAEEAVTVNVNTASAEEIANALVGVGLSKAEAIVAYRETNGAFQDVYELENVKGIGERTIDRNEARIRVK